MGSTLFVYVCFRSVGIKATVDGLVEKRVFPVKPPDKSAFPLMWETICGK